MKVITLIKFKDAYPCIGLIKIDEFDSIAVAFHGDLAFFGVASNRTKPYDFEPSCEAKRCCIQKVFETLSEFIKEINS